MPSSTPTAWRATKPVGRLVALGGHQRRGRKHHQPEGDQPERAVEENAVRRPAAWAWPQAPASAAARCSTNCLNTCPRWP